MTETNANASASIHVLADETLGGIKREYVEVDRKAKVGEKIVIVDKKYPDDVFKKGDIFTVDRDFYSEYSFVESDGAVSDTNSSGIVYHEEYHVLKPTDIVHIDSGRYELTDRKAEVGEKVIHMYEGESNGIAREVRNTDDEGVEVDPYEDEEGVWIGLDHGYYRVLVPVESAEADEPQPVDTVFAIGNLAQEVAKLQRRVFALELTNERQKIVNDRLKDEIDTLHKDNRTLGEELAQLKEPKDNETNYEDAALVFIQRNLAGRIEVYQDGKRLRGVLSVNINAKVGELTTHTIEFGTGNTAGERP
ncbi:hypothetical protein P5661_06540 [Bacillus subtilis]|uniref:hypothetical protein n=1 Tax=Bacillus subtilis TaxID=1423 RepID=UPI00240DAA0D|nr:hypothetical protein [Bacillus subtilis]WEZ21230.1 hypothetical protein P5661_06540 [Bacillus subtilis]